MSDAVDVAAYILTLTGPVTTMKLEKLVFYTQVRYLIKNGEPLFTNPIQAWAHGPVIPFLFRKHRGLFMVAPGQLGSVNPISIEGQRAAKKVVDVLGECSGDELRKFSHSERPWQEARGDCEPGDACETEITLDAIQKFYSSPTCTNPVLR